LSSDPDDPLSFFPSESDATVVDRPGDFSRLSNDTADEQYAFATRPRSEAAKTDSVALGPLQELAAQLAGELSRIQEAAREAEQRSATAMETVQGIEQRLGPLTALQDLSRHIDERFAALHALAEEVTDKSQSLSGQKEMIEQAEARLGRLEEVAAETAAQLERREQLRDELGRELLRLETEVQILTASAERQVEASKTESGVWEDLRGQLRETERAIKQSVAEGAALKDVLEDIGQRLGPLAALQDLSRHTDERFEALNALAEEVTVKGQTLNDQKEMIERAVVEAGRAAGLVDALDTRLAKLKDGDHLLELTEARFGRLEEVAAETTAQFQRKDRLRDELGLELVRLEMEVQILTESDRRLQELGRRTAEQFKALNALAEEVMVKGRTLTGQTEMIDLAVVEAGRVAELVSSMETRMARLKEEDHQREQTEARLERLEGVAADTTAQLRRSERLRDELGRELVRLKTEVQMLSESAPRQVDHVIDQEKEFAASDSRPFALRVLRHDHPAPIGSADVRVEAPLAGMDWEEPSGSLDVQLTELVTRLRTPNTTIVGSVRLQPDRVRLRLIKYWGTGAGMAWLVLVGFVVMRPAAKPALVERPPLPAQILASSTISVPVLSGTKLAPDEPKTPTVTARTPAAATKPPAIATRAPAVDARAAVPSPPPAEYFGTLAIESTPAGAAVFIDRQQVGQTPLELPHLRAGSHAVRVEREGYQRWTASVNVPASTVTRITVKLDAESGR
jgi:hypothetical protein